MFTIGAGYLDVQAALVSTDVASGTAHSPAAEYVSNKGTVNLLCDQGVVWLKLPVALGRRALHERGGCSSDPPLPAHLIAEGMRVAWRGSDLQLFSRVWTLGMGGLFISIPDPPPIGTKLRLSFEVPGGNVQAEAVVQNIVPGEGMGVEFTRLGLKDRVLLEQWLKWLLR